MFVRGAREKAETTDSTVFCVRMPCWEGGYESFHKYIFCASRRAVQGNVFDLGWWFGAAALRSQITKPVTIDDDESTAACPTLRSRVGFRNGIGVLQHRCHDTPPVAPKTCFADPQKPLQVEAQKTCLLGFVFIAKM